ncbi:hypothetical protein K2X89_07560 [Myxococcota bacterium]|nr:hypothetical protein [Myxococcota bacterium]
MIRQALFLSAGFAVGFISGIEFHPGWNIDWTAVGAIATLLAVLAALEPIRRASASRDSRNEALRIVLRPALTDALYACSHPTDPSGFPTKAFVQLRDLIDARWDDVGELRPVEIQTLNQAKTSIATADMNVGALMFAEEWLVLARLALDGRLGVEVIDLWSEREKQRDRVRETREVMLEEHL